jgi:ubiquinone/menaquinone biosynthesis C-methylase UbiE
MTENELKIKEFWDAQAKKPGSEMSSQDIIAQYLELAAILPEIQPNSSLLDMGCGNGWKTLGIMKEREGLSVLGIDYSEQLVTEANTAYTANAEKLKGTARFAQGDVFDEPWGDKQFDNVLSSRMLINLESSDKQIIAIDKLWRAVKPGGRLLLMESTVTGLDNINSVREIMGLDKIVPHWHNHYLGNAVVKHIAELVKQPKYKSVNDAYYFISRTINAIINAGDYVSELNRYAACLPQEIGDFSPLKLFILEKPEA